LTERPPRFAVVIPTHDRLGYLRQAVASVAAQTHPPDEILVVDDASSDCSAETIEREFPTVRVIRQARLGAAIARNTGIAATTAEWVFFLDDDDLWDGDKLEKMAGYIEEHPECEAVHHHSWFFSDRGGPTEGFGFDRDFVAADLQGCREAVTRLLQHSADAATFSNPVSYRRLMRQNLVPLSCCGVRRDLIVRAGCFPPSATEDWRMALNVARLTEWHEVPERLAFHRFHAGSTTSTSMEGIHVFVAYLDLWFGGNPFPGPPLSRTQRTEQLAEDSLMHRVMLQQMIWANLRAGKWAAARELVGLGTALLPSRLDRLRIRLPLRLTEHFER
jgi:glycosyltransferase involved in cell wall biosynthesis